MYLAKKVNIGMALILMCIVVACSPAPEEPTATSTIEPTDLPPPSVTPTPSADFFLERGLEYLQSNDFEKAYEDFSSAIALDSEKAKAYALIGEVIWRSSANYDEALANPAT